MGPLRSFRETGVSFKAALLQPLEPIGAKQLVLDDLHAIHPVLHMVALDQDAGVVPLADWLGDVARGNMQPVIGARRVRAVGPSRVVANFKLRQPARTRPRLLR